MELQPQDGPSWSQHCPPLPTAQAALCHHDHGTPGQRLPAAGKQSRVHLQATCVGTARSSVLSPLESGTQRSKSLLACACGRAAWSPCAGTVPRGLSGLHREFPLHQHLQPSP
ncbi:hypothetical protein H1C71_042443 [Ictidomys tridecemlineatus]|nr:hypothetical protein H1C71_042443 [Ictidomys tridecemlineatus]